MLSYRFIAFQFQFDFFFDFDNNRAEFKDSVVRLIREKNKLGQVFNRLDNTKANTRLKKRTG